MKKLLIVIAACAGLTSFADTLHLKSGSVLSGKVTAVAAEEITFESDDLGEIKVKTEVIAKLEDAGEHVVLFNDETRETKKLAVADGEIIADGDKLAMGSVKAIDPGVETWHGIVNGAFTASRGNSYDNTASVVANLNRRWEKDRLNIDFGYHFSKSAAAGEPRHKTTDRWEAEAQEDHFWSSVLYSYINLKYERDVIADLDARYRAGAGLGYQWLEDYKQEHTGTWSFNQEGGATWVREDYKIDADDEDGYCALRYAHHLKYLPKWNDGLEFFHNMEILPQVDDWEKFLAKTDIGFTTKLIYDFDLLAKTEWDYNSRPAQNRHKSDLRYIVGLGYKW